MFYPNFSLVVELEKSANLLPREITSLQYLFCIVSPSFFFDLVRFEFDSVSILVPYHVNIFPKLGNGPSMRCNLISIKAAYIVEHKS
ncbi:hypothetical protein SCA6_007083 [Theobroma cacao]